MGSIPSRPLGRNRSQIRKVSVLAESMNFMTGDDRDESSTLSDAVKDARREAAAAVARLAEAAMRYADARIAEATADSDFSPGRCKRPRPGEFVADELALMLRDQPYQVRCLLARSRRMAADLPTVWEASGAAMWMLSRFG